MSCSDVDLEASPLILGGAAPSFTAEFTADVFVVEWEVAAEPSTHAATAADRPEVFHQFDRRGARPSA